MAYSSDTQIKNLLKDIDEEADLNNLKPRFFQESKDDANLWTDVPGGLTFDYDNLDYGSCDFAWYIDKPTLIQERQSKTTPVIVVEGTLGLQRGNTGSAQFARFSHILGPSLNGYCAVLFQEKCTDYSGNKARTDPVFILAMIEIMHQTKGKCLFIDINDKETFINLLRAYDNEDTDAITRVERSIQIDMQKYVIENLSKTQKTFFADDGKNLILGNFLDLYNKRTKYKRIIKLMAFDHKAFTTSQGRNGHTTLGELLANSYCFPYSENYLLLPRIKNQDLMTFEGINSKELNHFLKNPKIKLLTYDNLSFDPEIEKYINEMEGKIYKGQKDIEKNNLDPNEYYSTQNKNKFLKKIEKKLLSGDIRINYDKKN